MIKSKQHYRCELYATRGALFMITVLLLALGLWYYFWYDPLYFNPENSIQNEDTAFNKEEFHRIDIITVVGTVLVFLAAIAYYRIFYHGSFFGFKYRYAIHSHTTEAFPMYTAIYTFGIGLLMPLIRYIIQQQDQSYSTGMYSYYPIVFLCMMFGYYLYELFKLYHHIPLC